MWLFRAFLVLILLSVALPAQEDLAGADPKNQFFAGNVIELSEGKVTVARTILGKTTATKSFIINSETKIEGKLHLKAKITVRYATTEDGDVAIDIIVRK